MTTIAASTIVPIAIAIPQSDMIFEGMPKSFIRAKVISTPMSKATTVTSDAQKFHKKRKRIIAVIISSAVSIDESVVTASFIRLVLS